MTGVLVLLGGAPFGPGCEFDRALADGARADEVLLLPTAAAYEDPNQLVAQATAWFADLGVAVRALDVLTRPQALDPVNADAVRSARFIYLAGGSALHFRSVLRQSPVWEALGAAWAGGATVCAATAAAQALGDPMVDARGGGYTTGLGLLPDLAVVPEVEHWTANVLDRVTHLAPPTTVLASLTSCAALIRDGERSWRTAGTGTVTLSRGGVALDVESLDL